MMGAGESILKSLEVGEAFLRIPSLSKIWSTVAPARKFESQQATVFIKEFDDDEDCVESKKFLECGLQTLKSLRHPRIVKYLDGSVTSTVACLIVERIRPLEYVLDDGLEKEEMLSGLCDIFDAVTFLHEKAGLSHNNIGPVAVFIATDGTWKLGSFECAQRLENCLHWCRTEFARTAKDDAFIPPEDKQMMYSNVPHYARDVYGLGKLVECLVPFLEEMLDEDQKMDVKRLVDMLTTAEASKRPPLSETDWKHVFRNDLYEISEFLRQLPLHGTEQKAQIFQNLLPMLQRLPQRLVAKRLSRYLLSRFVLLEKEAVDGFLPQFLDYLENDDSGLLSCHLFKQYVVPELKKVFCVHETAVRLALLKYFQLYCQAFDETTLRELILPELLLGMKDTDETIVAASMRCLADLIPLLGAEAVTGLKHTKYFCEGRPRDIPAMDFSKLTSVKEAVSTGHAETFLATSKSQSSSLLTKTRPTVNLATAVSSHQLEPQFNQISSAPVTIVNIPSPLESSSVQDCTVALSQIPDDGYEEKPDLDWVDWEEHGTSADVYLSIASPPEASNPPPPAAFSTPIERHTPSQRPAGVLKQLGSEFDVMAIEIKPPSIEVDLFADLAPTITPTRPSQKLELIAAQTKPISTEKFVASLVMEETDDAGWDDAQLNMASDD